MLQAHLPSAADRRADVAMTTSCPKCRGAQTRALTEAAFFVYLGCATCRHVWSVPERRQLRRFSTGTMTRFDD